jgi:photosystem II stability/assembly factor-like uncharacterized protein
MWFSAIAVALTLAPAYAQETSSSDAKPTLPESWLSSVEWRSVGPANMSGRIPSMAVYEKDPSMWWAASASGGLLKTVNNGATFEHQFDKEATVSIGDVQVYQKDPNILYVGTGEGNPRNSVSWGDGVYKSIDGGKTWKNIGLKKTYQIGRMAIHPDDPETLYVGALGRLWGASEDRGLYKTTDGGKNWKKILYVDDKTGVIDVQMSPSDPNTLFVAMYQRKRDGFDGNDPEVKFGSGAGIYRTTDGGETFTKLSDGLPTVKMGRIGLSIYRKDPTHVYAVVETEKIGQAPKNMAYAGITGEDAEVGAKLTRITSDGPGDKAGLKVDDIVVAVDGKIINSYNEFLETIRAAKAGEKAKLTISRERKTEEVEITYGNRPQNARRSRSPRGSTGQAPFAQSLGGQNANLQDQQGDDGHEYGGIYLSKDSGDTWERINSLNPRPMYYSQIRVDPSDNNYIWVLGTSLYKSEDGGKTFTGDGASGEVHVDHHSMWIDPSDGRHVILGNDGGLYVTWDRGKKWDHHNHVAIGQFYHVGIGPNKDYHVYGGLQDNGSWGGPARIRNDSGSINSDWYRVGSGDGFIVLVDPKDKDQIYFESQNGAMGRIHLKTGERGFIRPRAPRGTRYRFNWKTPFILSPHNSQIHYSAGNHVFRSVYKGDGVKAISPEITNTDKGAGSAISESAAEEGVIYVGTTDGALWVTTDGGKQWVDLFKNPETVNAPASSTGGGRGPGGRGARGGVRGGGGRGAGGRGPGGRGAGGQNPNRPPAEGRPQRPEGAPTPEADRPDPPPAGAERRGGSRANFMARVIERLKENDKNKDGKIEKDELPERMQGMFDRLDRNKDGAITEDEMKPPTTDGDPEVFTSGWLQEEAKPQEEKKEETTDEKKEADKTEAAADVKDIVSGTWDAKFITDRMSEERRAFKLVLRLGKDGKKLTGEMDGGLAGGGDIEGTWNAKTKSAEFSVETDRFNIDFVGKIAGKALTGDIEINGGSFSMEYEGTRTGDAPAAGEKTEEKSKDDGSKPIKELVAEPRWVSSLSASKFANGRCYVTFDGHRSNDDEPYVFATENYGKTWRSIRANLPTMAGSTRVIREDLENQDILYLGCEFSVWVSIDRGKSWTKFNNNLPTVAVHEFAQHPTTGDIVAGTHGRSLWIANVNTLRQLTSKTMSADAHLFKPSEVTRWRTFARRGAVGTRTFKADNPSSQAVVHYALGKRATSVKLRISDIKGETVYEADGETTAGLHAWTWNLSRQRAGATGGGARGGRGGRGFRGRTVPSGTYLVTLMVDGNEMKEEINITNDPTFGSTATTDEEYELMQLLYGVGEEEGDDDSDDDIN